MSAVLGLETLIQAQRRPFTAATHPTILDRLPSPPIRRDMYPSLPDYRRHLQELRFLSLQSHNRRHPIILDTYRRIRQLTLYPLNLPSRIQGVLPSRLSRVVAEMTPVDLVAPLVVVVVTPLMEHPRSRKEQERRPIALRLRFLTRR